MTSSYSVHLYPDFTSTIYNKNNSLRGVFCTCRFFFYLRHTKSFVYTPVCLLFNFLLFMLYPLKQNLYLRRSNELELQTTCFVDFSSIPPFSNWVETPETHSKTFRHDTTRDLFLQSLNFSIYLIIIEVPNITIVVKNKDMIIFNITLRIRDLFHWNSMDTTIWPNNMVL